ncbi:MAG: HAMP domain-containing protein, partial [Proteobacteria bacterium]|nr:HAMP domain-containing protein [Pseudomonadota bacterium]MBU1451312.1 HAMP domain-containing protein [Pseudomonadota bacterium]
MGDTKTGWRSIGRVLAGLVLVVALVPLVVVAAFTALNVKDETERMRAGSQKLASEMKSFAGEETANLARATMDNIDDYLRMHLMDVRWLSRTPQVVRAAQEAAVKARRMGLVGMSEARLEARMKNSPALDDNKSLVAVLKGLQERMPAFKEVFFTDSHGFNVAYTNRTSDFVQAGENWWESAWRDGVYLGKVVFDSSAKVFAMDVALRIEDAQGKPVGVLKAVLDVNQVRRRVAEVAKGLSNAEVLLFDGSGRLLADSNVGVDNNDGKLLAINLFAKKWAPAQEAVRLSPGASGYMLGQQNLKGLPVVVGYAASLGGKYFKIGEAVEMPWYLAMSVSEAHALRPVKALASAVKTLNEAKLQALWMMLAICLGAALLATLAALFFSRRITRPLKQMAEASRRLGEGDMTVDVPVLRRDETGVLARAFNHMVARVRTSQADMAQKAQEERETKLYLEETISQYVAFVEKVGQGDLTASVRPPKADDQLG